MSQLGLLLVDIPQGGLILLLIEIVYFHSETVTAPGINS